MTIPLYSQSCLEKEQKTYNGYIWPTNSGQYISGTFAEVRGDHFHSGLDIKTWGRIGYEVYAIKNGRIMRILAKSSGYGKALYIRHDDNTWSVYAHLSKYMPEIQSYVDSLRLKRGISELNLYLNDPIYVKQGQLIGYTGESGNGPPHLHIELRDPQNQPINPLLSNLKDYINDTIPPQIKALLIVPLSPTTRINGLTNTPLIIEKSDTSPNYFGEVTIQGKIGIAAEVYDYANKVNNIYNVAGIQMIKNNSMFFCKNYTQFNFSKTRQVMLDRNYKLIVEQNREFIQLFKSQGNTVSFINTQPSGIVEPFEGQHHIDIMAYDIYGNIATAKLNIISKNKTYIDFGTLDNTTQKHTKNMSTIYVKQQKLYKNYSHKPQKHTIQKALSTPPKPISYNGTILGVLWDGGTDHQRIYLIPNKLYLETSNYTLYSPNTLFASYKYHLDTLNVLIAPQTIPIKQSLQLKYVVSNISNAKKIGCYAKNEKKNTWYMASSSFSENTLTCDLEYIGHWYVFADTTAPSIHNIQVKKDYFKHYHIALDITDDYSGIDMKQTKLWVNDVLGIAEYDPEKKELIYYHPNFKPQAKNTLKVEAWDQAGNIHHQTYSIPFEI